MPRRLCPVAKYSSACGAQPKTINPQYKEWCKAENKRLREEKSALKKQRQAAKKAKLQAMKAKKSEEKAKKSEEKAKKSEEQKEKFEELAINYASDVSIYSELDRA